MQMCELAESAIDAIGRCALQVPSSAESCLATLIRMISSNNTQEQVVCASGFKFIYFCILHYNEF